MRVSSSSIINLLSSLADWIEPGNNRDDSIIAETSFFTSNGYEMNPYGTK
jgi:hypothetical protein